MRLLIVGVGALGGVIGARLLARGVSVALATRDASSAAGLKAAGLHVTGVGGEVAARGVDVRALGDWPQSAFDLVVLATKADDALSIAPRCVELLAPGGTLLPIQNGAVAQVLARQHSRVVLGGLSNLGATMMAPGRYEQRNAGHILMGELAGGMTERATQIASFLNLGIETRTTANMNGAIWSKLLLNCTVTTLGAVAGTTMRGYITHPEGRALFDRTYDETLSVAFASGVRPERMLVDPIPPLDRDAWIDRILAAYGDLRPSMHQDFERGRPTEIEFINGYVAKLGLELGVLAPLNAAIADTVRAISRGESKPSLENLARILRG
ncbi:ketopantoate reductase family protein [Pendulispora brunnea]|uniref:2-dehydropantoate 2-reductase n=1 Tax=Pendulispora brunnea TaxID=2905690 RepID=A0ABZ2K0N9_9BACT